MQKGEVVNLFYKKMFVPFSESGAESCSFSNSDTTETSGINAKQANDFKCCRISEFSTNDCCKPRF